MGGAQGIELTWVFSYERIFTDLGQPSDQVAMLMILLD